MDKASSFSQGLFLWVQPLMWTGVRRPLRAEDVLKLPARLQPETTYKRWEAAWSDQVSEAEALQREPSVARVFWRLFGSDFTLALLLQTAAVFCKFGCVILLRRLVSLIIYGGSKSDGAGIAVGLAVLNAGDTLISTFATWRLMLLVYAMLEAISQAVLRKGFCLHPGVQGTFRRGDLVNLALSDCNRLVEMTNVLMLGVTAPIMLVVAVIFLIILLGPLVLAALIAVLALMLVIRKIGQVQGSTFRRKAVQQGRRLAVVNEMLQSVRFTKFYTLEDHYEKQVLLARKPEVSALRDMKATIAVAWPTAALVPITTAAIVLALHIAIRGRLPSAPDTLALLAISRFMCFPFAFFGAFLGAINMLSAVCRRLQQLLVQPEVDNRPFEELPVGATGDLPPALSIRSSDFRWDLPTDNESDNAPRPPTLRAIDFEVPRGELWAIVGPLGSGKSSLLAAASGGISLEGRGPGSGVTASGPTRVFVAQEPMVMNATIRDNVLFGAKEEEDKLEERYQQALEAAALFQDLEVFPAGDETEIGEKGLTLSGGQKARVALARAVLASRPGGLVLLDDPLAAVDAHVGAHLFERCIVEALAGTTRLLVTNQLQFLDHPAIARVLVMEEGRIVEQGKFGDLASDRQSRLSKMLASVGSGKSRRVAETPPIASIEGTPGPGPRTTSAGSSMTKWTEAGKLMRAEEKAVGAITFETLRFYARSIGGWPVLVAIILASWLFHLSELIPDLFLAVWQDDLLGQEEGWYLGVWIAIGMACVVMCFASRAIWVVATLRGANAIHSEMLRKVLHCTTSFFDRTPSGRIMNRFGEDQMLVDWTVALQLEVSCIAMWTVLNQVVLATVVRPLVAPFLVGFALLFAGLREIHRRANREATRWQLVTKSPLFSVFEETLSGATTIQAFGREAFFQKRFAEALRENLSWLLTKDASNLWVEQRLGILGALVVLVLAFQLIYLPGKVSSSIAAVGVIYALQLGFNLKTMVYFCVQAEGTFASVERILDFTKTAEQEPPWELPVDRALEAQGWPGLDAGLEFEAVCVRYQAQMPLALDNLSFQLLPREKVGIVGRTGSGKSSVMGALFRLFAMESGRIILGGVDIATCGLALLRRRITIVPQDPILFSGELRKNLDPLGQRSDEEVWAALHRCSLDELVSNLQGRLSANVAEGGRNFSVGERQVLCLARALLRGTRVLCLDEATANVDPANDQRIQKVLGTEVQDCLVLTIAHRLHTVLRADRIMVLDRGRVAQLDSPEELLRAPGIFRELAAQAGISSKALVTAAAAVRHDVACCALPRRGSLLGCFAPSLRTGDKASTGPASVACDSSMRDAANTADHPPQEGQTPGRAPLMSYMSRVCN